ncbi:hypothetical protein HHK36_005206 [Tetracentron sinense]|uniref:Disease resistance R13L4/SHOC-2-like LRR domain-containing protein n=1 Tax=Tetracentron sinense TaxID=13715 RepID=A0A834ZPX6_TETSI|nr:hypothetical protein HHK36_005206 [Tetracentron sinense]
MASVLVITNTFFPLLLIFLSLICFGRSGVKEQVEAAGVEVQAGRLPHDEGLVTTSIMCGPNMSLSEFDCCDVVVALHQIAKRLGKSDWNFSENPCDGDPSWATAKDKARPLFNNTLTCNCSFPNGVCHVDAIDLSRNYLSGTIPSKWASTQLEYLSVIVNRLSGPIPKELGNFTTLKYLSLEANQFFGALPSELGDLINIQSITLNSNNFTGELPMSLANLTKLTELISSNSFTGKIPDFIKNWRQLDKLEIQASGLEGPIPASISSLDKLSELRISDLNGEGSVFPPLRNMTVLTKLMLRNCNISGQIPQDIAVLAKLKTL